MEEIIRFIEGEPSIRVAILNGSRVNINAPIDALQDYDVACFLDQEWAAYKTNHDWMKRFGERVIFQQNEDEESTYFLMQFKTERIDLSFHPLKNLQKHLNEDSLSEVLVDKDNRITTDIVANESSYYIQKPTEHDYLHVLNEAWWISTYVAKGLVRHEMVYAKYMFDHILIERIKTLIYWSLSLSKNWHYNPGKCGKWLKRDLGEEAYHEFLSLYPSVKREEMWLLLFKTGEWIEKLGKTIGLELGYFYPVEEAEKVHDFLKHLFESSQ